MTLEAFRLCLLLCLLIANLCVASPASASASSHQDPSAAGNLNETPRPNAALSQQDITALKPGEITKREMSGGETHTFQVELMTGQYVRVVIEQRGIDLSVALSGPDARRLTEMDNPNGTHGPEFVSAIADAPGNYRVEVRSNKGAAAGSYEIRIDELRPQTPEDKNRIAAERAFAEGQRLRSQGTPESRQKAIQKYEEALRLWRNEGYRYGEALTLQSIGGAYRSLGDQQKALEFYNQALPIFQSLDDRRGQALMLNNMGLARTLLGNPKRALEDYDQSLSLWAAERDSSMEANTLNNIGGVYDVLGEPHKALEHYNRALDVWQQLGNREKVAIAHNNIGNIYDELSESQKALESYQRALTLFKELKMRSGEAIALDNIGLVYQALGDPQTALRYYEEALQIREELKETQGQATTFTNMGLAYNSLGDPRKALEYHDRALPLMQTAKDPRGEAYTLTMMGMAYTALGESQRALEFYERALQLRKNINDHRGQATTLDQMGQVYLLLGNLPKASELYDQALALWQATGDRQGEASTLYGLARIESSRGNLRAARERIEKAISVVESLRNRVSNQQLRISYFATKHDYYELYIDLRMRLHQLSPSEGHDAAALQASERARARSLLDTLTEARVDVRQGVDPVLIEQDRKVQQQLGAKAERLTRLLNLKRTEEAASLAKDIEALTTTYNEVQAQIRARSPHYAALTQPEPLTLKEIQQQLLDDNTLLLEYALGTERSYLWVVDRKKLTSYQLPARAKIEEAARRVRQLLIARQPLPGEAFQQYRARVAEADLQYRAQAAALSQTLLGPLAAQLEKSRLVIVTEGSLQYIPFGALPVPETAGSTGGRKLETPLPQSSDLVPIIVDHEVINLPSASTLAVLRRETDQRKGAPRTVAVLADPVFETDDPRIKLASKAAGAGKQPRPQDLERALRDTGETGERLNFPRLLSSRQEARNIMALIPAGAGMEAIDFKANRATAMSPDLGQYRIVHFATHGILDDVHPELSGIVLSLIDEQGRPQNGFLRLHDIYNLKLPAELIVLSACRTGLGKEIRGEGLVGLTRGFMYAGAMRVVASLWKVDDEATGELMKQFYQRMLREGMTPTAALRSAQVAMWQQKRWHAPYYWAAFILQGEWR